MKLELTFLHEYNPIWECTTILIHHVNKNDHQFLTRNDPLKSVEQGTFCKALYDVLQPLQAEMGAYFDNHYQQERFLFTITDEYNTAPAMKILTDINPYCNDHTAIFKALHDQVSKDPYFLLRKLITDIETDVKKRPEKDLLNCLDDMNITDDMKWKLIKLNTHANETLQILEAILTGVQSIYRSYAKGIQTFLQIYEDGLKQDYEQGDMLHHFLEENHIQLNDANKIIYVIPSFSAYNAMILTETEYCTGHIYIIWGLCITMKSEQRKILDREQICSSLKLLSDKSKFDILRLLSTQRLYGAQLAKIMKLSTPTISYHLQALLNSGFIRLEKEDNRLYYQLNQDYVDLFFDEVKIMLKGQ